MQLKPAEPLLLTNRGCPLAFDVIDTNNPDGGIIGRATYTRWATRQGVIEYTVKIQIGDRCLLGPLFVKALKKF